MIRAKSPSVERWQYPATQQGRSGLRASSRALSVVAAMAMLSPATAQRDPLLQPLASVEFRVDWLYADQATTDKLALLYADSAAPADSIGVTRLQPSRAFRNTLAEERGGVRAVRLGTSKVIAPAGGSTRFVLGGQFAVPSVPDPQAPRGDADPRAGSGALSLPPGVDPGKIRALHERSRVEREFGVTLELRPLVRPDGTLLVRVAPSVRGVDFADARSVGGRIFPQLTMRGTNRSVDLSPGQSFVVSGLLTDADIQALRRISRLAGFERLNRLIALRNNRPNGRLLLIVTPRVVAPAQGS